MLIEIWVLNLFLEIFTSVFYAVNAFFNRPVEEEVVDKDRILQQKEAEVRGTF